MYPYPRDMCEDFNRTRQWQKLAIDIDQTSNEHLDANTHRLKGHLKIRFSSISLFKSLQFFELSQSGRFDS